MSARIFVFDSGIGGLTILGAIQKRLGTGEYYYAFDNACYPYGTKSVSFLRKRVQTVISALVQEANPDILVIACNTVSTFALPMLRKIYSFPIVGVVPPLKPVCLISKSKKVAILGTEQTIQRKYVDDLIQEYGNGCQVFKWGSSQLVALAEEKFYTGKNVLSEVRKEIESFDPDPDIDAVALGCTHFPHLVAELSTLYPQIQWMDPSAGVAHRVAVLLQEFVQQNSAITTTVFSTKKDAETHLDPWKNYHVKEFRFLSIS